MPRVWFAGFGVTSPSCCGMSLCSFLAASPDESFRGDFINISFAFGASTSMVGPVVTCERKAVEEVLEVPGGVVAAAPKAVFDEAPEKVFAIEASESVAGLAPSPKVKLPLALSDPGGIPNRPPGFPTPGVFPSHVVRGFIPLLAGDLSVGDFVVPSMVAAGEEVGLRGLSGDVAGLTPKKDPEAVVPNGDPAGPPVIGPNPGNVLEAVPVLP